jgi:hypothetical protein
VVSTGPIRTNRLYHPLVDLDAFYSVVSGINFTLLGLWWVAIKERGDIGARDTGNRRMAYIVSLQFLIPGTISLLSQVAPDKPLIWRLSFTIAGLAGAAGILLLTPSFERATGQATVAALLRWAVVPLYLVVALVAAVPPVGAIFDGHLTPLQVEAILLCLLVFLGVQAAWVVAMAPKADAPPS